MSAARQPEAGSRLGRPAKALLVGEIIATYVHVRWLLARRDLPQTVEALRRPPRVRIGVVLRDGERWGNRLGAAVDRTFDRVPVRALCLARSLVLLRLLARRRAEGSLVIAVSPTEAAGLDAHAWIELNGRPVLTPAPAFGRLLTL